MMEVVLQSSEGERADFEKMMPEKKSNGEMCHKGGEKYLVGPLQITPTWPWTLYLEGQMK